MKQQKYKLRNIIRRWLGLGELFMGVDISGSQKDQSTIVIVSRLNGGSVRIISSYFGSIQEIENLTKELKNRYGISYQNIYEDWPLGMSKNFTKNTNLTKK